MVGEMKWVAIGDCTWHRVKVTPTRASLYGNLMKYVARATCTWIEVSCDLAMIAVLVRA